MKWTLNEEHLAITNTYKLHNVIDAAKSHALLQREASEEGRRMAKAHQQIAIPIEFNQTIQSFMYNSFGLNDGEITIPTGLNYSNIYSILVPYEYLALHLNYFDEVQSASPTNAAQFIELKKTYEVSLNGGVAQTSINSISSHIITF